MADYSPPYANGRRPFTLTASAAVVGGTLIEASTTGSAATTALNSTKCVGVVAHDTASGQRVSVWPLDGVTHEITHTAGGSVGDCLTSLATGLLATTAAGTAHAAGTDLGTALTTAAPATKIRFIGR